MLSINASGRGAGSDGVESIISIANNIDNMWKVIFVSEFDYLARSEVELQGFDNHAVYRHWGGHGHRAMAFILHDSICRHVHTLK